MSDPRPQAPTEPSGEPSAWQRYAHIVGLILLALVTVYGLREFIGGDWEAVTRYWRAQLHLLPWILLLFLIDVSLEGVAWIWVYERFGMRAADSRGFAVYLSGNAGLLLPAQLGRLIRPDSMIQLGRGTMPQCLKAEASVFLLDALSVVSLLAGCVLWGIHPLAALVGVPLIIACALYLAHLVADRLTGTKLGLPRDFWWNWQSFTIVLVEMAGWAIHGASFYILVSDLPGNMTLRDALFFAPGSAVLGVGTGLPGGLGATEGLLGSALRFNQVPAEHLALVVGAFRVVTFWIRLPIGWTALWWARRKGRFAMARRAAAAEAVTTGGLDGAGPS